jgi:zinc protease
MRYRSYLLDNGLSIALGEIPGSPNLCIHAAVRSGAIYETACANGVSHLLEHFHAMQSAGDGSLESAGSDVLRTCASFDAWLELDSSHYSITTSLEHAVAACHQLVLGLSNLNISDEHFEQEKRVVAVEIEPTKGRDFLSAIYEKVFSGTPYGMPIAGRRQSVGRLARRTLEDYDRQFYDPRSISIGIVGELPSHILDEILTALSSLRGNIGWRPLVPPICTPQRGRVNCWSTQRRECVVALSIPPSAPYDDVLCLRVIAVSCLSRNWNFPAWSLA